MLGYGLVNSSVHDLCLTEIIFSFLSRSSLYLSPYYYSLLAKKISSKSLTDEDVKPIIKVFLEEEKILYKNSLKQQGLPDQQIESIEEEILYKYVLSANIIYNQNYNYDGKDVNKVVEDGLVALNIIFRKVLDNFFEYFVSITKDKITIPDLALENTTKSEDYLLNLIKFSTFTFENNAVVRRNYAQEKKLMWEGNMQYVVNTPESLCFFMGVGGNEKHDELPTFRPIGTGQNPCSLQEIPNYNYFSTGGKFLNYGRSNNDELNIGPFLFGEFYYTVKQDKINSFVNKYLKLYDSKDVNNNIFYELQYSLSQVNPEVFDSLQKFDFFDDVKYSVSITNLEFISIINDNVPDSFIFDFEYKTLSTGQIEKFKSLPVSSNDSDVSKQVKLTDNTSPVFFIDEDHELKIVGQWNGNNEYSSIDDVFLTKPIIFNSKNYKLILSAGYYWSGTWINPNKFGFNDDYEYRLNWITGNPMSVSTKTEFITNFGSMAISRNEILKYYKFSFRELKNIVKEIRNNKEKFEDYFDLNYRVMLNLTADLSINAGATVENFFLKNHYIQDLFNVPKEQSNLYPPYYKNKAFAVNEAPLLSGKFFNVYKPDAFDQKIPAGGAEEQVYPQNYQIMKDNWDKALKTTFSFLSKQIGGLTPNKDGFYDPKDNELIKMLLRKEGVVITTDHIYAIDSNLSENDPYYKIYNITKFIKFNTNASFGSNETGKYVFKCNRTIGEKPIFGNFYTSYLKNNLKTSYILTLMDFKVENNSQDIYFSDTDDPKQAIFNLKVKYYKEIFNKIKEELNNDPRLKTIIDNIDYTKINNFSSFDVLSSYSDEIKKQNSKVISFYTKPLTDKVKINLLYARDNALNILNQQIRVLEDG